MAAIGHKFVPRWSFSEDMEALCCWPFGDSRRRCICTMSWNTIWWFTMAVKRAPIHTMTKGQKRTTQKVAWPHRMPARCVIGNGHPLARKKLRLLFVVVSHTVSRWSWAGFVRRSTTI